MLYVYCMSVMPLYPRHHHRRQIYSYIAGSFSCGFVFVSFCCFRNGRIRNFADVITMPNIVWIDNKQNKNGNGDWMERKTSNEKTKRKTKNARKNRENGVQTCEYFAKINVEWDVWRWFNVCYVHYIVWNIGCLEK